MIECGAVEKGFKISRQGRGKGKILQKMPRQRKLVQIKEKEELKLQQKPAESNEVQIVDKERMKAIKKNDVKVTRRDGNAT